MNAFLDRLRAQPFFAEPDTPLGAMDLFHVHTDAEMRAEGAGHNVCALVAWLDGRADVDHLRARAATLPELSWRLGRHWKRGWIWRDDGPGVDVEVLRGETSLEDTTALVSDGVTAARPFRLLVRRGAEADAVVLLWYHATTDALGAGRLLQWLGGDDELPEKRRMTSDRLLRKLEPAEQRELIQSYIAHVEAVGDAPILSLRSTTQARPGRPRAIRHRLSEEDTAAFDASLRRRAGLADTSILLWAATRMADRLLQARGFAPVHHVVPLPLSLDPKKGSRRMFGNHLTMMLMRLDRDDLADEARAVKHLAEQRREVVRGKLDVAMVAAVRATGWMPWRVVDHVSRRPFGGERSSLIMSNPGAIGLEVLGGVPVRDALAMPTVLPAPGFQVTTDRHRGRLSVLVMVRDGVVAPGEVEAQVPAFVADLLADC